MNSTHSRLLSFHLEDGTCIRDPKGVYFSDDGAALVEAAAIAQELSKATGMRVQEQSTYFDDKTLVATIVAYDKTCRSLEPSGLHPLFREITGKRIIEAARQGERDSELLYQRALNTVGIEKTGNVLAA